MPFMFVILEKLGKFGIITLIFSGEETEAQSNLFACS